jgi:hypothetical protein
VQISGAETAGAVTPTLRHTCKSTRQSNRVVRCDSAEMDDNDHSDHSSDTNSSHSDTDSHHESSHLLSVNAPKSSRTGRCRKAIWISLIAALIAGVALACYFLLKHAKPGSPAEPTNNMSAYQIACSVFCNSSLLTAVQMAQVFNDSKTFVDMPMLQNASVILEAFASDNPSTQEELASFVSRYFGAAGSDLVPFVPPDYNPNATILSSVTEPAYAAWLSELNALWPTFTYTPSRDVTLNQSMHTLLATKHAIVGM